MGHSTQPVHQERPTYTPGGFAPLAASSRIDIGSTDASRGGVAASYV